MIVCVADIGGLLIGIVYLQQDQKDTSEQGTCIADDDDGHLIYQAGDLLQARCTSIFVMFSLELYFMFLCLLFGSLM